MAMLAPRPAPVQVGKYRAIPRFAGSTVESWTISGPNGSMVASLTAEQFESYGQRMLECYDAGKPFVASERFAGEDLAPEVVAERRIEVLEKGRDHVLAVPEFTRYLAAEEARAQGLFRDAVDRYPAEQWPGFERDLFATLYGGAEPVAEPNEADGWMRKLLELAGETAEFRRLAAQCEGDPWAAGLGAGELTQALSPEINDALEQLPGRDPAELQADAEALEELREGAGAATAEEAEQALVAAQAVETKLDAQKVETKIRDIVRAAAREASKAIDEMSDAMAGLGAGSVPGVLSRVHAPRGEIRARLERDQKLRRIANIAGRLRMRARAKQRTKVNYTPEQVVDVTLGSDIQRLLPSETMLLAEPETEFLLMRRLFEGTALQYRLEGREQADQGPVILAVDNSASMTGLRNEWAMGVALALLEVCAIQKRPFCLIHFDQRVQAVFEVPASRGLTLEQLVEMVSHFSGGGTEFEPPLREALARIEQAGTFAKSDVILLTDGCGSWGGGVKALEEAGALVYGVAIEDRFSPEQAKELAGVAEIRNLSASDAEIDLVFGI